MRCKCGKTALYTVRREGFCREHYADAVKARAAQLNQQKAFAIARGFKK